MRTFLLTLFLLTLGCTPPVVYRRSLIIMWATEPGKDQMTEMYQEERTERPPGWSPWPTHGLAGEWTYEAAEQD